MIEFILFVLMATSLVGMVVCGINDPLTRRFMEDWENDHARRYKAHRR